jgi:hypothetical protein
MNDEATTHYSAIIDNMALGFKTLHDIFGSKDSFLCSFTAFEMYSNRCRNFRTVFGSKGGLAD